MKVVTNNDDLWFRGFSESFVVRHEALSFLLLVFLFLFLLFFAALFVLPFFSPFFLTTEKHHKWCHESFETCTSLVNGILIETLSSSVSAGHEEGHLQEPCAPNVVSRLKPASNVLCYSFQLFLVFFWRRGISERTDLSPRLALIPQSNCSQSVRKLLPLRLLLSLKETPILLLFEKVRQTRGKSNDVCETQRVEIL